MFEVTVVVPVFNAANYVRQAVDSALKLREVSEVVLIEDNSSDDSLRICVDLQKEFSKVKLYRHPNGENRGAGASRNLGIEKSSCPFIAFLDADDYFLSDRFTKAKRIFEAHPDADGVYEAVAIFNEGDNSGGKLYTVTRSDISPQRLFHFLLRGTFGHFHTNAILVRKTLFQQSGIFNTQLRLHQDSELWLRLAYHGKLYAGNISKPVTMVRRHGKNRITHANNNSRQQFWQIVKAYFLEQRISKVDAALILWKYSKVLASVGGEISFLIFVSVLHRERKALLKIILGS